jgi:hypothetical protein
MIFVATNTFVLLVLNSRPFYVRFRLKPAIQTVTVVIHIDKNAVEIVEADTD